MRSVGGRAAPWAATSPVTNWVSTPGRWAPPGTESVESQAMPKGRSVMVKPDSPSPSQNQRPVLGGDLQRVAEVQLIDHGGRGGRQGGGEGDVAQGRWWSGQDETGGVEGGRARRPGMDPHAPGAPFDAGDREPQVDGGTQVGGHRPGQGAVAGGDPVDLDARLGEPGVHDGLLEGEQQRDLVELGIEVPPIVRLDQERTRRSPATGCRRSPAVSARPTPRPGRHPRDGRGRGPRPGPRGRRRTRRTR